MKTGKAGFPAAVLFVVFLLAGCAVVPGPRGTGVVLVPALPEIVVLEEAPYYFYGGYHYYYRNDLWFYSRSRSGPWVELPRDRYPRETRFKSRGGGRGWGEGPDRYERGR